MKTRFSIEDLIYLDKEYISGQYEEIKGISPHTNITKTEGVNAGLKIPLLSAGASSIESKSYKLSVVGMLNEISDNLSNKGNFLSCKHDVGKKSHYVWVTGNMTVMKITVKRNKYTLQLIGESKENEGEEIIAKESYFSIRGENDSKFALITTPDYFTSGVNSIVDLCGSVVNEISFPVKALLRVLPVKGECAEWLSIPLVITEHGGYSEVGSNTI